MNTRSMAVLLALAVLPLARAHATESEQKPTGAAPGSASSAAPSKGARESGAASSAKRDDPGMPRDEVKGDAARKAGTEKVSHSVVGTVEKAEGGALTLRSSKLSDPYRVTLREDTPVVREGETISRDEIAEGDQVRATFVGDPERGGEATEVAVIRKGGGKATQGTERTTAGEPERRDAPPSTPSRGQ